MGQSFQGEGPSLTPIEDSSYKRAKDKISAGTLRPTDEARECVEKTNKKKTQEKLLGITVWTRGWAQSRGNRGTGKEEEGEKESKRDTGKKKERERGIRAWNRFFRQFFRHSASADMPNFAGTWKMKRSENFDELLKALGKPSPLSFLPLLSPLHSQRYIPAWGWLSILSI